MAITELIQSDFFSSVLLPFVLVFTILFSFLQRKHPISDRPGVNGVIALIITLLFIGIPSAVGVTMRFIPIVAAIIIIFAGFMITFGAIGFEWSSTELKGLRTTFAIILGIALVFALIWAANINVKRYFHPINPEIVQYIVFLGVIIAVMIIIIAGEGKGKKGGSEKKTE